MPKMNLNIINGLNERIRNLKNQNPLRLFFASSIFEKFCFEMK